MWRLILFLAFVQFPFLIFAEQVKVTTWNLEWFPSGSPNLAPPDVEAKRIKEAAEVLRKINPDVILLQEIRDLQSCEQLAAALRPSSYSVAVCSRFKDGFGGAIGRQQVAILSKKTATAAWSKKWHSFGIVDPPRGYAFAAIRFGTNDVGFYSLHLKSNLTRTNPEKENQMNILKRELAADQVLQHVRQIGTVLTNELESVVIAGDFNTNPDQSLFVSERTLSAFANEGFNNGFEGLPLRRRITHPGKGRYPDATFDYIFVMNGKSNGAEIMNVSVSDHLPVTRTLQIP